MATRKPKQTIKSHNRRKTNAAARDQFAALGRFIQSFEQIVWKLRAHAHWMMRCHGLGVFQPDNRVLHEWDHITSMVFHHEVINAKAMSEIWGSMLTEHALALRKTDKITEKGEYVVKCVAAEIISEFSKIYETRNRLIHATWSIGLWAPFEELSTLKVEKFTTRRTSGFKKRDDLPKDFDELFEEGTRCLRLREKLSRLLQFYEYRPGAVERFFILDQRAEAPRRWNFVRPPTPLPHTWPEK